MLQIKGLNKSFGKSRVLTDIDLNIEENKIYGLLGRNGVGKTTLLNLISSQLLRDRGQIKLDGEEVFENPKAIHWKSNYIRLNHRLSFKGKAYYV